MRVKQGGCGHLPWQTWTRCFTFLKMNFLFCINVTLILADAPEGVGGREHNCCPAIDMKRCNFLYYYCFTSFLPSFHSSPSYLPPLAWKSKLNGQSQSLVPFCYNLYDLGDITLSSEPVFLYHKQEMDTPAEYLYI